MKRFSLLITCVLYFSAHSVYCQCDSIALIGEFSGWVSDTLLLADETNPDLCSLTISFTAFDDTDENGLIDMKFRTVGNWVNNWGDDAFPSGVGIVDGPNIPVLAGDYVVIFNCSTHEYHFTDFVDIKEEQSRNYRLFPNPATNVLHLAQAAPISYIEVYSLVGQCVYKLSNDGENEVEINISELDPGIFFVKTVTINGLSQTKKFVKN